MCVCVFFFFKCAQAVTNEGHAIKASIERIETLKSLQPAASLALITISIVVIVFTVVTVVYTTRIVMVEQRAFLYQRLGCQQPAKCEGKKD